jgi:excisionase family DNA binding protein
MDRELLTVEEVARFLEVHVLTVYRWCREGRLPATKVGREWRIRRATIDDFLQRGQRKETLVAHLQSFFEIPDDVLAVAENEKLLHRLDAAFFQMAEARGGVLVKFYSGEPNSADELRVAFTRGGLEVAELEQEGRFRFYNSDPTGERSEALRRLLADLTGEGRGRTVYAAFDWMKSVPLEHLQRQQEALMQIVDPNNLVMKMSVLAQVADEWSTATQRLAQYQHRGTIWLSDDRLSLSRTTPTPQH